MRKLISAIFVVAALTYFNPVATAQLNQIGGGNAGGGTGGAGQGASANPGSTTQGIGGRTTQGIGAGGTTTAAPEFVGGGVNADNAFVGSGVQTQRNNARQFRAITNNEIPTGRPTETSGTPRQIPVSLRIGFALPQPQMISQLIGPVNRPIQRVAMARPELKQVDVQFAKGGVAVLVGQVPSADSRRLAANLVRLQPGVRSIDNRLLVAQPATAPQPVKPSRM